MAARARDLLLELGTEELPPKALVQLMQALAAGMERQLTQAGVRFAAIHPYATPRRLALWIERVAPAQPDRVVERRGPKRAAAWDAGGNPTQAALGFARACGVPVEALETIEHNGEAWLAYRRTEPGRPTVELLPDMVRTALDQLPVPKRMRWGALEAAFVRPVHWMVLLYGDTVVPCECYGVRAGRKSRGHRFHHPRALSVRGPRHYAGLLEQRGHVIADVAARRARIAEQVTRAARNAGGSALIEDALLDEVTALVEWPVAIAGGFDAQFLELPREVLIATMQVHQRYFPVVDAGGALRPHFVAVANIESRDPDEVRRGNERVLRPRLSDAAFFWDQDRKTPLHERLDGLRAMVYQDRLGTLYDKTARVERLARAIARELGEDPEAAALAARLAKCDLLTEMVGEFPELQGVMGRYYAEHDGVAPAVARAIEEHYRPRYAGDAIAPTPLGRALAIADRCDTLVGIFAAGLRPSGEKDPYALRRAALGVLRTLIEGGLELDLRGLLEQAAQGFDAALHAERAVGEVFEFMMERLRAYYAEQGIRADVFEAVLAVQPSRPLDFDRRLRAVTEFQRLPEAESLAVANKRIRNILRQAGVTEAGEIDPGRLSEPAEQALAQALDALAREVEPLLESGAYTPAMQALARLREPVDRFFDEVMVMVDDPALRANRLALLHRLSSLFLRVADLSRLQ